MGSLPLTNVFHYITCKGTLGGGVDIHMHWTQSCQVVRRTCISSVLVFIGFHNSINT